MHWRIKSLSLHVFVPFTAVLVLAAPGRSQAAADAPSWSDSDLVPSFAEVVGQSALNHGAASLSFERVVSEAKAIQAARTGDPFGDWIGDGAAHPEATQSRLLARAPQPAASPDAAESTRAKAAADLKRAVTAKLTAVWRKTRHHLVDAKARAGAMWQRATLNLEGVVARLQGTLFGSDPVIDPRPLGVIAKPITAPPAGELQKITLARVIAEPTEVQPLRPVALVPEAAPSPEAAPKSATAVPKMTLKRVLKPEPELEPLTAPVKTAALQPAAKAERPIQRRRLRPFDAESLGITVTAGSSADSLARMLSEVSTRPPAAPGFGPAMTSAERTIPFVRFLGSKQGLFSSD